MCLSVLFLFTNALSLLSRCSASDYLFWYRQKFDISRQNMFILNTKALICAKQQYVFNNVTTCTKTAYFNKNVANLAFCVSVLWATVCLAVHFRLTDALSVLTRSSATGCPFWYRQPFDISKQNLTYNMLRKTLKIPKGNQNP